MHHYYDRGRMLRRILWETNYRIKVSYQHVPTIIHSRYNQYVMQTHACNIKTLKAMLIPKQMDTNFSSVIINWNFIEKLSCTGLKLGNSYTPKYLLINSQIIGYWDSFEKMLTLAWMNNKGTARQSIPSLNEILGKCII